MKPMKGHRVLFAKRKNSTTCRCKNFGVLYNYYIFMLIRSFAFPELAGRVATFPKFTTKK